MNTFPTHGPIVCRSCFPDGSDCHTSQGWRICNDPGAWGASKPKVLVLGFSKGFTQAGAFRNGDFDAVAFAGARDRIKSVLVASGILGDDRDIHSVFTKEERSLAFGSLVRCSLSRQHEKDGLFKATGPLVKKSFHEEPAKHYVHACAQKFLSSLPETLRLVLLLGNDSGYIRGVREVIRQLHPRNFLDVNEVCYQASGIPWVHVAHPSGSNGHFSSWLHGNTSTTQGRKKAFALEALMRYGLRVNLP